MVWLLQDKLTPFPKEDVRVEISSEVDGTSEIEYIVHADFLGEAIGELIGENQKLQGLNHGLELRGEGVLKELQDCQHEHKEVLCKLQQEVIELEEEKKNLLRLCEEKEQRTDEVETSLVLANEAKRTLELTCNQLSEELEVK